MGRSALLRLQVPAHHRCMHLLLIEDRPGTAASSAEALERAGHQVHRCHEPGAKAFPCNGLTAACPLDSRRPIDLVVDVRCGSSATATAGEAGGTCALRRDVPVLVDGRTDPFPGWSAVRREDEDLADACERAVADHDRARAATIEAEIDRLIGVSPADGSTVTFSTTETGTSILVKVPGKVSPQLAGVLATRVHAIERDRGAVHAVLDISVSGIEPG